MRRAQPKGPSKRTAALARAKVAGFEGDSRTFTRLVVEARVNRVDLNAAWRAGVAQRVWRAWDNPVPMPCGAPARVEAAGRETTPGGRACHESAAFVRVEDGAAVAFRCARCRAEEVSRG